MMNVLRRIDGMKKYRKQMDICILIILFISLFLAVNQTEYHYDDLVYMNQWDSDIPLQSLGDIIDYQIHHYFEWGGRTVAHTIVQLLFLMGKPISSIISTCVYFLLAGLIVYNATGKLELRMYIIAMGLFSFLNPYIDETILWYTGSANYLFTTVIILIGLIPVFRVLRNEKIQKIDYCLLPFTFLGGWCNENISSVAVLLIIYALYIDYIKHKKLNVWLVLATILWGVGTCLLIFAPGNGVRSSSLPTGLMAILYRGHGQLNAWFNWLLPAWLVLIAIIFVSNTQKREMDQFSKVIIIFAVLSILIMIASPTYPERAVFGSLAFIVIAIVRMISKLENETIDQIVFICELMTLGMIAKMLSVGVLASARSSGVEIPG